jgi:hypothetical protein
MDAVAFFGTQRVDGSKDTHKKLELVMLSLLKCGAYTWECNLLGDMVSTNFTWKATQKL